MGVPSPREQIEFLQKLQRLLDEGVFVASYKYALLHAIADLCITRGDDSGDELELSTREIAERFIELYWRQSVPFPGGERFDVLKQNTGRQAAVVRELHETRSQYGERLARLKDESDEWSRILRSVDRRVRDMPLWRLQTVGQEEVEFLYENEGRGKSIVLRPGVAYCFRAFYPLVLDLIEGAWSHYVRRQNQDLLGTSTDLRSFLFGSDRTALARYRPVLEEVQDDVCLYCRDRLGSRKTDLDHFIPWRRYPTDLGHNFVLVHATCNSRKGDRLAAVPHLRRWRDRNVEKGRALARGFDELGVAHDLEASWSVARWAYRQVESTGGQVWVEGSRLEHLSGEWVRVLGADSG